ncbi:putative transcriptional regulatory protein [Colletotrichum spinosum]|uniref:Putative transcriptional regulatory protein n=1 Tax=Colletotrichum spinosum TaxID=1347390 RepID=A0A4R8QLT0_9PEZI|nr:putative transcriptional regulatory protein [Colletotrichum spinosum]
MGSPTCYPDARRYSRLEPPYVYADRQQRYSSSNSTTSTSASTTSEARTSTMTERESETDTPPRKRIAVACGRCRKRKIRCSGDAGHGMPCQNCKAAGADNCMFLRVASQEAPWVSPTDPSFPYELKTARAFAHSAHALGSPLTASAAAHYGPEMHDGLSRHAGYPPSSAASYSYGAGKYYPSMPSWPATPAAAYAAAADDGTGTVDYSSAMGYTYPYHSHDQSYLYRMAAAKPAASPDLYVNTDTAAYAYSSTPLVHRPASAAANPSPADTTPSFSLSAVAASLPQTNGGGGAGGGGTADRLLPNPRPYRTETPTYAAAAPAKQQAVSTSPGPDVYDAAQQPAYPPAAHTLPSMTHMRDAVVAGYPASSASSADSVFSASESSYKYTDASSSHSSSSSSGGGGRRGSGEASTSSVPGSLANGQAYTVTAPSMYAAVAGRHVGAYALLDEEQAHQHHQHHQHQHQHQQHHHAGRRVGSLSAS